MRSHVLTLRKNRWIPDLQDRLRALPAILQQALGADHAEAEEASNAASFSCLALCLALWSCLSCLKWNHEIYYIPKIPRIPRFTIQHHVNPRLSLMNIRCWWFDGEDDEIWWTKINHQIIRCHGRWMDDFDGFICPKFGYCKFGDVHRKNDDKLRWTQENVVFTPANLW
jgi:hypothetical protein